MASTLWHRCHELVHLDRLSVDSGRSRSPSVQLARLEVVDCAICGVGLRGLEVENVAGDVVGALSGA
jgi:hypothetical protein